MSAQILNQIANLIQENHFEEAQSVISRVAAVQSTDPVILREVAKLSLLMGDLTNAEKHLLASLALKEADADSHFQLGLVLMKKGQNDQAMPAFRTACELNSNFALGHFYWGLSLYQMGNTQGALGQFKLAAQLDKSLFLALYYAGLACQSLGQIEEARQYFEQTVAADATFAPAYNALGVYFFKHNKIDEAISYFQRACKLRPGFPEAHFNLANIFVAMDKYETAEMHYKEAINSSELSASERTAAYNNLATIYAKSKNWEMASDFLLLAKSISPNDINIQTNLGLIRIALHEYDLALGNFEQIITTKAISKENNVEANFYSGVSCLCLGNYEQAQDRLVKAAEYAKKSSLQASSSTPPINLWLAYAYTANKDFNSAKSILEKVIAPNSGADKQLLGLSLDALGIVEALQENHENAKTYFTKALELDNNMSFAYLHRGHSLEALGLNELAKKDYAQAIKLDPNSLRADKDYISQLLENAQAGNTLKFAWKIVEIDPNDIESMLLAAKALQQESNYDSALVTLKEIIQKEPNNGQARVMLGQIYMAQGDFAQADEIFLQASKLPNVDAELFLSWARALAYLGFHELALEKFKLAADSDPYNSDVYESWAQALKSLGRFNEASEVYRLASSYL